MRIENGSCYPDGPGQTARKVVGCRVLEHPRLQVKFNNGEERVVDLAPLLELPAFRPLSAEEVFRACGVEHGVVTWRDGELDIAPEWLFEHGVSCWQGGKDHAECVAEPAVDYEA